MVWTRDFLKSFPTSVKHLVALLSVNGAFKAMLTRALCTKLLWELRATVLLCDKALISEVMVKPKVCRIFNTAVGHECALTG